MANASGVAKLVALKKESAWGVAAGASGARYLRRVTSDLSLQKQTYESDEIRSDYQVADYRHGVRSINGALDGELSAGSYSDLMGTMVRRLFTSVASITGVSLTIAASGAFWNITRAAGDYLTAGPKVGDVVRLSVGTLNALNLNKNLLIVALTSSIMTVMVGNGSAMFAEGPITGCTISAPGKKTWVPQTGHIDESYSYEHFFSDIAQSELFVGLKPATAEFNLPPTGMARVKFTFMGKDMIPATAQYFATPAAAGVTGVMAAVNGAVIVNGVAVAQLTGMNYTINGNYSAEPVVGLNTYSDIQEGRVKVNGQFTAMFSDATFRDIFANETEATIVLFFSASNSAAADFITFTMPRIKAGGSSKSDSEKAIIQTIPFVGLLALTGGSGQSFEQTTLSIQDSQAA